MPRDTQSWTRCRSCAPPLHRCAFGFVRFWFAAHAPRCSTAHTLATVCAALALVCRIRALAGPPMPWRCSHLSDHRSAMALSMNMECMLSMCRHTRSIHALCLLYSGMLPMHSCTCYLTFSDAARHAGVVARRGVPPCHARINELPGPSSRHARCCGRVRRWCARTLSGASSTPLF